MMSDYKETSETKEGDSSQESSTGLGAEGLRAMRGIEPQTGPKEQEKPTGTTETPSFTLDESQIQPAQFPYDSTALEYRKGSPHADHQLAKGLEMAERWHELRRQAATATSLSVAIANMIAAHKESSGSNEETPMDKYFYEKYGRTPYTEAAYPQDEGES
jgi:hypothetical protein